MTLMEKLRSEIKSGRVPPIFKPSDLTAANIADPNANLSNYDKKNQGSLNKKVLVSLRRSRFFGQSAKLRLTG